MLFDLTGFQRDVLIIINGLGQPSGQEIKKTYEEGTQTETTHGRLYSNLNKLETHEYITKGDLDDRTNYYEITPSGKRMINSQLEWESKYVDFEEIIG